MNKRFQRQFLFRWQDKRGSIMVFSMWVLIFLSMLNVALYGMVSSHIKVAQKVRQRVVCPYSAKSAFYQASLERKNDPTPGYDTAYELGAERRAELGTAGYVYFLEDEERRININTASQDILSRLPGLNEELAADIIASKMYPFQAEEELLLIEGVTQEIFDRFKGLITIHGKGGVNINTASAEVLAALGMDEGLIRIIQKYRGDEDGMKVNEESLFFKDVETIVENLQAVSGLFQKQEKIVSDLISRRMLQVSGSAFALRVRTEILNKPAGNYTIVMEDDNITDWSEQ